MEEVIIRQICERMAGLEALVKAHLDAEWKFWAFMGSLGVGIVVAIIQNAITHKAIKNGTCKKL